MKMKRQYTKEYKEEETLVREQGYSVVEAVKSLALSNQRRSRARYF